MARRRPKTLDQHVEEFANVLIKRHTAERNFEAVVEDFAWIGKFHEMQAEQSEATLKEVKAEATAIRATT